MTWFLFALWLVLVIIDFRAKKLMWSVVASIVGMFFGVILVSDISLIIGISVIFLNVYLLWNSLFKEVKKKK